MRDVFIRGVAMSPFARAADRPIDDLAQDAAREALADAGIPPRRVDAIFAGHTFGGRVAGQRITRDLGLDARLAVNVENACASGATALHLAIGQVRAGASDIALALGFERLSAFGRGVVPPDRNDLEGLLGRTNPATYALMTKRHMAEYGTTLAQLAAVSVKARRNGAANPRAQFRTTVTAEEVLASPPVADPVTRLMCCPTGDGAAAVVVSSTSGPGAIRVRASVVRGGQRRPPGDRLVNHPVTETAARAAYAEAGVGPEDVDVAEVHDAFAIAEIVHLEDLGFRPRGESAAFVASGGTAIDGALPVNPSGGLLAKGHPYGATGLAQIFELVEQLRGRAGTRQVARAHVALAQCEGGIVYGLDAGACAIHILEAVSGPGEPQRSSTSRAARA
jgi:benzoylsuccinyl-CoA thiolase BbsB subunit